MIKHELISSDTLLHETFVHFYEAVRANFLISLLTLMNNMSPRNINSVRNYDYLNFSSCRSLMNPSSLSKLVAMRLSEINPSSLSKFVAMRLSEISLSNVSQNYIYKVLTLLFLFLSWRFLKLNSRLTVCLLVFFLTSNWQSHGDSFFHSILINACYSCVDLKFTGRFLTKLGPKPRPVALWGLKCEPSDSFIMP